jgi:hypothetical protein
MRPTAGRLRPLQGSWCRDPPQQCGPFGAKLKKSILYSKKIQHKHNSGKRFWALKQASDSIFELTLWYKTLHPHTNESKFQLKLCSGLTMWPCKQPTDSNIELTLWCKTQHAHTQDKNIQHRTWSGLTMWPYKQASDLKFKHDAAPRWALMSTQGWEMHQKKWDLPLELKGPWRGLGAETPPQQCGPFGAKLKISALH